MRKNKQNIRQDAHKISTVIEEQEVPVLTTSCNHIKHIAPFRKGIEVIKYVAKTRAWPVIVIIVSVLVGSIFLRNSETYALNNLWSNYITQEKLLSSVIQLATFIGIGGLWLGAIIKEWKDSLNKYLTVSFVHSNKLRIRCRYAKLTSEADARGMAQSFGQTLNCAYLKISPSLNEISQHIEVDKNPHTTDNCKLINKGVPFLHYEVDILLVENVSVLCKKKENKMFRYISELHGKYAEPDHNKEQSAETLAEEEKPHTYSPSQSEIIIPKDQYLLWDYPFDVATEANLRDFDDDHH